MFAAFSGKLNAVIYGKLLAVYNDTFYEDTHGISSGSYDENEDDVVDELDIAGLDRDELEFMDEDERREALEDAGLDPDDFDDFDF